MFLDDQPALEARYGTRVPVLRDERGERELDWPFDAATVQAWLAVDQCRPLAGNPSVPVMPASGRHYRI